MEKQLKMARRLQTVYVGPAKLMLAIYRRLLFAICILSFLMSAATIFILYMAGDESSGLTVLDRV